MAELPSYWQTDLDTLEGLARCASRARVRSIAASPGGRPVWCFTYGEKQTIVSPANYNSACGAHDRKAYFDLPDKKPVILLVGAIHGHETEGVAALMNLVHLLEYDVDLAGQANPALTGLAQSTRLVIVPIANPDGRARVVPAAVVGLKNSDMQYWGQGTWKDGSLCQWPDCKKVHPIHDAAGFLGGYFNDDGINLMHDQFFRPMAAETQAILDLAMSEFADCTLLLHGGSNSVNDLLQPGYVPLEVNQAVCRLAARCHEAARPEQLSFNLRQPTGKEQGATPPSFNLVSAIHHACGGVCAVFESNQGISDLPGVQMSLDQIYRSHMILFEQTLRHFLDNIRG